MLARTSHSLDFRPDTTVFVSCTVDRGIYTGVSFFVGLPVIFLQSSFVISFYSIFTSWLWAAFIDYFSLQALCLLFDGSYHDSRMIPVDLRYALKKSYIVPRTQDLPNAPVRSPKAPRTLMRLPSTN